MRINFVDGKSLLDVAAIKLYNNNEDEIFSGGCSRIDNTNSSQRDLLIYNSVDGELPQDVALYSAENELGSYNKIILFSEYKKKVSGATSLGYIEHITKIRTYDSAGQLVYEITDINYTGNKTDVISVFSVAGSMSTKDISISNHEQNYGSHIDDIFGVLSNMPEYALIDQNTSKGLFLKVPTAYISRFLVGADGSMTYLGELVN